MNIEDIVKSLKANWKNERTIENVLIDGIEYNVYARIKYYKKWFVGKEKHTVFIDIVEN